MVDELELLRNVARVLELDADVDRQGAEGHGRERQGAEGRVREALEGAIAAARPVRRVAPVRRPRWVARLGGAAALAGVALLVAALLRSGSTAGPPPAAATVLRQLARVAASQPNLVPGPDQYLYTASHSWNTNTDVSEGGVVCQFSVAQYRQNWIARDGHGLFIEQDGPQSVARGSAPGCSARLRAEGGGPQTSRNWAAPGCLALSTVDLGKLPLDPAKLRARLLTGRVEGGPPGPAEAFAQVADLLRESDASAPLRASLYRAAAGLPGVISLGTVTDELGREGVGLAIDGHGTRHELIFDPATSALTAEQGIQIGRPARGGAPVGTVLYWSAYAEPRLVDRLPQPSPLPLTPNCLRGSGTTLQVPGRPEDSVLVGGAPRP